MLNCSIIIRAYNEEKHLGRLLEGLLHQTVKDVEVILVDSGSSDSTISIAQSFGSQIIHIPADEFTFGRSLNLGIQAASNDYVVIASAHVYPVYPDWLECLLRPFDNQNVALAYGKQRGSETSKFSERLIFRQWFPDVDSPRQPGPFCNNANAAVRKSLWERHAYDETLTGLEDIEWAKWAQSEGWAVSYVTQAEVVHIHDETGQGVQNRYRREAMAFKRIFPESHFNIYDFVRLTLTNIVSDLSSATRPGVKAGNLASIFSFRLNQFWGTYQGYRHSSSVTPYLRQTFYYPHRMESRKELERGIQPIRYNQGDRKE
jgi:rhamnosyltransferase